VSRAISSDLELDKVIQLVAAQARTRLGRRILTDSVAMPAFDEAVRLAGLTLQLAHLLDDDGPLTFAGLDDAVEWLQPDSPAPTDPRELLTLLTLARHIGAVRRRLFDGSDELQALAAGLPDTSDLVKKVAPRLGRDGTISDNASPELQRLRRQSGQVRHEVLERLETIRRSHSDITTDAPPTVRRERYCLPVRASARAQLPSLLLDTSSSGATAFVEPLEMVELNNQLAETAARERAEIRRIVAEIVAVFLDLKDHLFSATDILARLDAAQARVLFGQMVEGRVVIPGGGRELIVHGARHPLLDERLHALRVDIFGDSERRDPARRVVPLDFRLPEGGRTLIVSGPNAGGKTVVLKTVGLMVLMAYHGIPLPADEGTVIPEFDNTWCHIGDEQDVAADLSSFSGAMAATVRLLEEAGPGSLVLYDELGSGTDPLEGAAIGCALLEELTTRGCVTVVTTHLAAISMSAGAIDGMNTAAVGFDEDTGLPTYSLIIGRPGRSRALEIAARTGVPDSILTRAHDLLGGQHLELHRLLEQLEKLEGELHREQKDLAHEWSALRRLEEDTENQRAQLEAERARLPREISAERDRLRQAAKRQLDEALGRLDTAVEKAERIGKRQRQRMRDEALDLGRPGVGKPAARAELTPGNRVRLIGLGGTGVLDDIRGNRALVTVEGKRLWVSTSELAVAEGGPHRSMPAKVEVTSDSEVEHELMLLGKNGEQAREELERFLDRALTAGRSTVRIVHGHGTGVLRRTVAEVCRSHPAVRSFRHPPQHFGGTGATEVTLDTGD
jgi:DNA mismatch repair protein MutS2